MQPLAQRDAEVLFLIVTSASVAVNAQNLQTVTTPAENAFQLHAIVGMSDQDAVANIRPNNFTVSIRTDASNIDWMNSPIPQRLICGTGENQGFPFPVPIIYPPKTTFQVNFTNLNAAASILTLVLIGYRLKNPPSMYGV